MSAAQRPKRIIVGLSGASGAILGMRALEMLKAAGVETYLVITPAAERTILEETDWTVAAVKALADVCYDSDDIGAAIASGSFSTDGMLVAPCSSKTLSAIANAFNHNLLVRAADVCLKEGRPLLLAVREAPLHRGHTRLLDLAASSGAIIFPPVPAFYARPQSINEMIDQIVGRMLLRLGVENEGYVAWGSEG
ncbi:MAG: UbiX family flavin prenyltransferase [Anaerolineales bacterium]|nr:UbiX family flavin prenyltransferase [Anaerolineales bacterium]